jgi:DnaA family protein
MRQLPLGVRLRERATLESFEPGNNSHALSALQDLAARRACGLYWLAGPVAAGKSHLLQAVCAAAATAGTACYLPLRELAPLGDAVLAGWEQCHCVCVDDVDAIIGQRDWERALFALYRDCEERQAALLFAAACAPTALRFSLPDLASRCAAAAQLSLSPLDESQQAQALQRRARLRGLELPLESIQYLQRRQPRDMRTQCALLDSLDDAALQAQRRITVPFIRQVLDGG